MSELESKKDLARKNFIFRNRKASKEENQVLIERIDSLSEAAKLRNILQISHQRVFIIRLSFHGKRSGKHLFMKTFLQYFYHLWQRLFWKDRHLGRGMFHKIEI